MRPRLLFLLAAGWLLATGAGAAERFSVATYNVENYLDGPVPGRTAKSVEAKARVRDTLLAVRADVLALQEMGGTNALLELRATLQTAGLDYPHWEHITGRDTNIHVAVLSRFPIVARRPHTDDSFLLNARRFRVSRGFVELDIQVTPQFQFTLLAAHLKSKRPVPEADQADLREQEALLLREKIDARLKASPAAPLLVLGDLNDTRGAKPIRTIIGRARNALVDLRPEEATRAAPDAPLQRLGTNVTWTYFYNREDTYSRFDYVLASRALASRIVPELTCILALPWWREASDHRPVLATFSLGPDK
ncbi:MAG: endonuclease/exonuclease/phosphatase family protein [Verrucomicrobia bacterium]|nr:endonuclease/exonuclease/phosphatase family protein [Verrucomicrobiota bacterium]